LVSVYTCTLCDKPLFVHPYCLVAMNLSGLLFKSHDRPEWGTECQTRLNSDDHKATRELAQTPLLLTLICILFLKRGEFPTKRSTLYAEAVWTLLAEWDASKDIVRQQPYKGLDTKCKEIMLAEIAYSNFTSNNLFFQQGEITQQIEQILKEMLTDEKRIDGRDVLRAVEEQHGLLVNRYENIYSFSHLTIQEFLTAKHIIDNQLDISAIVQEHLCDKRWNEVFLLLAGLRKADDLLLAIDQEAMNYMATPKLQRLLAWVEEVADPIPGNLQPVGKRAIASANVNAISDTYSYVNTYANAITNTYAYVYAYDYKANDNAIAIANANANAYANAINYFIRYTKWAIEFEIYQGLGLTTAINKVEKLRDKIPDNSQLQAVQQKFARQLIEIFLATFRLTPEMVNLSQEEIRAFDNYFYAVWLLIECERTAVRRTPEVWSQIEERLLIKAITTN
jgi:hypothetical protein